MSGDKHLAGPWHWHNGSIVQANGYIVAKAMVSRPIPIPIKNNTLMVNPSDLVPPVSQGELFHVEKQAEINGIEMGVLENGMPYLTESGLARMCGIDRKVLNRLAINWSEEKLKPRGQKIAARAVIAKAAGSP